MLDPDMPSQELRLHMGEMIAQEERTARAAIRWANATLADELLALAAECGRSTAHPGNHARQIADRLRAIVDALRARSPLDAGDDVRQRSLAGDA